MIFQALKTTKSLKEAKHIAFIGQKGTPAEFIGTSGVEFYVEYRAEALIESGKLVSCYVRNWATPPGTNSYKQIKLIHIPTINTKHLDATVHSFLASIHVSFTSADTVWYQASGPALFSFIPKLAGKKIIVTIHALDWQRAKWGVFAKVMIRLGEQIGCAVADDIITVSPTLSEYVRDTYRRSSIVDPPVVEKKPRLKPSVITKKYGLKGNDYILYMGRFVPEKRIEWLIEAYNILNPRNIILVLAGYIGKNDSYEKNIYKLAADNRNIMLLGYVFGRVKNELLANCRVFVIPSLLEGNPYVLADAAKYKVPIIVPESLSSVTETFEKMHLYNRYDFNEFVSVLNRAL